MLSNLLALLLVALPTQTPAPATAPASAESFIPANALAVIRIRSIDAVDHAAQAIVPGSKVGDEILGVLPLVAQAHVVTEQVDRTSPIILAACPSQVKPPVEMMIILTCKDPVAFTAPLQKMGWTCTTAGKIVACSPSKPGPALAADAPMRTGLDHNDVVLRVAMDKTMSQFGELIKAGLDNEAQQVESQIPDENAGAQVSSMLTSMSEGLDELEMFEINLSQHGDQTRLGFEMTALADSSLAKVEKVDVSALPTAARILDGGSSMSMLVALDFSKMMKSIEGFMDAVVVSMPEQQRAAFASIIKMSKDLQDRAGPAMAANFDFGAGGMRGTTYVQSKDPTAYMNTMLEFFKSGIPWMPMTKSEHAQIDGVDVSTYHFALDAKALPKPATGTLTPEAQAKLEKDMQAVLGPDGMQVSIAAANGGIVSVVGDVAQMKDMLARASSKSASPLGAELMKEMGGMNPGFVIRMDLGRMMSTKTPALDAMSDEQQAVMGQAMEMFHSMPPLQFAGGVEGRVWRLGISTDVAKIVAGFMQMKDAVVQTGATKGATGSPRAKAKADIAAITTALDAYAMNNSGKYPDTLEVLITPDLKGVRYLEMKKLPLDPWGHAYVYTPPKSPNDHPRVVSLGADGRVGGTGDNADIDGQSEDHDDH